MASTTEINPECAAHFELQLRKGNDELDVFAIIGLHADDHQLDLTRLRSHIIKTVIPHVFERRGTKSTPARTATSGAKVPTWDQVKAAKDIFSELTDSGLRHLQKKWRDKSEQTWNPFEAPNDPRALVPKSELTTMMVGDINIYRSILSGSIPSMARSGHQNEKVSTYQMVTFITANAIQSQWYEASERQNGERSRRTGCGKWHLLTFSRRCGPPAQARALDRDGRNGPSLPCLRAKIRPKISRKVPLPGVRC